MPVRTTAGVTTPGAHTVNATISVGGETHVIPVTIVMHGADSIILTSPNGQENWPGALHQIEWTYTGNPGATVRLELLKNGTLDSLIADNVPIGANGSGSFGWVIPSDSLFSQFAKVRVTSDSRPDISDTSDDRFWTGHGAELLNPVGGQLINIGDGGFTVFYTWTGLGAGSFELYKGGVLMKTFPSEGNGYFDGPGWTWANFLFPLPDVPEGNDYTLRIIPGTDVTRASFNPGGAFSLIRPTASITSPVVGQVFQPGDQVTIAWTTHSVPTASDVKLTVNDPAAPFDPMRRLDIATVPLGSAGAGSFIWTVPANAVPSRGYVIGAQVLGPLQFGIASQPFTIGRFNKLTITASGNGGVQGSDPSQQLNISCFVNVTCDVFLLSGKPVTLKAITFTGWKFTGWTGVCTGTADCTVTLAADAVLGANFVSTAPDFSFTTQNPTATVQSGSAATYTFSLASLNNLSGTVGLNCSNLPVNARCSFAPGSAALSSLPVTVTLTITTNGGTSTNATSVQQRAMGTRPWLPVSLLTAPVAILAFTSRRRIRALVRLGTAALLLATLSCGGGGNTGGPVPVFPPSPNTPVGSYVINVNVASQTPPVIQHTSQVMLVVK